MLQRIRELAVQAGNATLSASDRSQIQAEVDQLSAEIDSISAKTHFNGKLIDKRARAFLKTSGLDYEHGTGHGVGFFSNVHEGPQAISKSNTIKLQEGMILSNEPGYYKRGKFGIRLENLLYIKKYNKNFFLLI